jgi:hypothetical protein
MKPWEKALEIGTLILEQQELPEFDLEILRDALELALEVWYDRDAENYEVLAVEELIDSRPVTNSPLKGWYGTIDLALKDKYSNDVKIIDWKTTSGQLDKTWERRQRYSWQPQLYMYHFPVQLAEIRGVHLGYRRPETRTLEIKQKCLNQNEYIHQILNMISVLHPEKIWPRHMPKGCDAFGPLHTCEFFSDCEENKLVVFPSAFNPDNIDYTGAEEFLRCPERFRRLKIQEAEGKKKPQASETKMGTAFHAAMKEIYSQLQKEQENG